MRPRTLASIIAAPLAAAAVGVAVAPGAPVTSRHPAATSRTITLFQGADEPQTFVDAAPLSPTRDSGSPRFRTSPGDHLYLGAPLRARKGGVRVGRIDLELTALRGQGDKVVTFVRGVIVLKDGILTLDGIYPRSGGFAVTGGTGAYAGAHGIARQDDTGVDTITLTR